MSLVAREVAEHLTRLAKTDPNVADVVAFAGGLDIGACQAAGLAHDLGHPPFGHAGEVALNKHLTGVAAAGDSARDRDGFEGNAQTFRIVTTLDTRKPPVDEHAESVGLDLTHVTLGAILKYPTLRPSGPLKSKPPKFGAYTSETIAFGVVRAAVANRLEPGQQTLEASVMDLADDITYAIHDLEDFFLADLIDFGRVNRDLRSAPKAIKAGTSDTTNPFALEAARLTGKAPFDREAFVDAIEGVRQLVATYLLERFAGSSAEIGKLREALSNEVSTQFSAISVRRPKAGDSTPLVAPRADAWHRMQVLKTITRVFVVSTPRMGLIERAQFEVIAKLYDSLVDWLRTEPELRTLPQPLRTYVQEIERRAAVRGSKTPRAFSPSHLRAAADYICSLSDAQALSRSNWLAGRDVPGMGLLIAER